MSVAPHPSPSLAATWFQALTLAERAAVIDAPAAPDRPDADAAGYWARWRDQPPFADDDILTQRLAHLGLDLPRFRAILSTPAAALQTQHAASPPWLADLLAAYADPITPLPEPGDDEYGFLEVARPLIDRACADLDVCVDELAATYAELPFDPAAIADLLLENLLGPLLMRLGRTMVLELNVARLLDQLEGDTTAARFHSFIARLQDPAAAQAILADYPVLARQLAICIDQWRAVSDEFLRRLCADWPDLCRHFSPAANPGPLVELVGGAGDTHRGGRAVMIAEFASGLRIVYKPKSLAVDRHFQDLLVWLNAHGCEPPLQPLTVLDRYTYGWVEFVAHRGCDTRAQVRRYYRRQGAYLALLYAINASDFHLENLIAAGEQPILIDLETLFNPEFERFDAADAGANAAQRMLDSVLVVGMLPQRLWSDDAYGGIDISGLGGEEGQLSPDRLPTPDAVGTDEMRYVRARTPLAAEANRPMLKDVVTSAVDYADDLLAGFRAMYGLLRQHRAELLADDGPLARFADDETRLLLRPTRTYDQLLFESFHPDMLHDELARELHWDRLWLVVPARPYMAGVVPVEQADLRRGDIPVFTTRPASLQLYGAEGEPIPGVLTETGMAVARRRLARLDAADMAHQEWIIRCTLATVAPSGRGFDHPRPQPAARAVQHGAPDFDPAALRGELLTAARGVADQLLDSAIEGDDDITWLGLTPLPEEYWDLAPLEMDLYGGVAGITLFLAYAGAHLGDERYTAAARRGSGALRRHIEFAGADVPGIGGFVGWGGMLYTLTHLAALWRDGEVSAQAEAVVEIIARFVADDEAYSVMYGAAGAIGALLAYARHTASTAARQAAVACGEHLLAAAQPQARGLGWVNPEFGPHALTGFGHGAAGIAWALLHLASATGDARYGDAAHKAMDYERSVFLPGTANWPDLRVTATLPDGADAGPRCMTAWCHGAVGIGLARLDIRRHLADPAWSRADESNIMGSNAIDQEIQTALQTTLAHGFGRDHSLCHGDMAALELLLQAELLPDGVDGPRRHAARVRATAALLADGLAGGWRCGGPEAVTMPSLMLGLAGIGYQLLRLADPDRVPSLLLMAPPT